MHQLVQRLNPHHDNDLNWDYEDISPLLSDEIKAITEHFNATGFDELLNPMRQLVVTDKSTGVDYAQIQDSNPNGHTVVAHFNPFSNGLTDNMLMRATYLQHVFEAFNIKLPLITFGAPSGSHNLVHDKKLRAQISAGNFKPLADKYVDIIEEHGYTKLSIIGFSQGATLAAAVAARAIQRGIVVSHLAVGEPANILKRTKRQLGSDFGAGANTLNEVLRTSGIEHLKNFYVNRNTISYTLGLAKMPRLNMALVSGMAKPTFDTDLREVLAQDTLVTVGWGGLNTISPAHVMQSLVADSRTTHAKHHHAIHTVEIDNAHHTWADRLNLLATFYAYALLR